MSKPKEKIGLICRKIEYSDFSIIYTVEPEKEVPNGFYPVFCGLDVSYKELILKPTLYSEKDNKVVFTTSNVTPSFYLAIMNGLMRKDEIEEYSSELKNIYLEGDKVGYILV